MVVYAPSNAASILPYRLGNFEIPNLQHTLKQKRRKEAWRSPVDKSCDLLEVLLGEAARRQSRGAHSEASWHQGWLVSWDSVLVGSNVGQLKYALHTAAIDALAPQVHQHQVVLSACSGSRAQLWQTELGRWEPDLMRPKVASEGSPTRKELYAADGNEPL